MTLPQYDYTVLEIFSYLWNYIYYLSIYKNDFVLKDSFLLRLINVLGKSKNDLWKYLKRICYQNISLLQNFYSTSSIPKYIK